MRCFTCHFNLFQRDSSNKNETVYSNKPPLDSVSYQSKILELSETRTLLVLKGNEIHITHDLLRYENDSLAYVPINRRSEYLSGKKRPNGN